MHTMALSRSCSLALVTAFWLDDGTKRDHNDGRGQRWRMWIREESSLTILEAGDKVVWESLTRAISTIAPAQLSGRCAEQATTLLEDQQVKLHSWLMLTTWHGVNTYQHQHMFDILWHSLTIFFELVILLVGPSGLSLGDTSFYYLLPKQWSSNTMICCTLWSRATLSVEVKLLLVYIAFETNSLDPSTSWFPTTYTSYTQYIVIF